MKYILFITLLFVNSVYSQYNNEVKTYTLLKSDTNLLGQKYRFPQGMGSEITILKVVIPPGSSTGWHKHPFPVFAVITKGVLNIEIEGREPYQIKAGDANSEVINTFHIGVNKGNEDVEIFAFYLGKKGIPLVIKK